MRYATSSARQAGTARACGHTVQMPSAAPIAVDLIWTIVGLTLILAPGMSSALEPGAQAPRRPLDASTLWVTQGLEHQLVVKFADAVMARAADDGSIMSLTSRDIAGARALGAKYNAEFLQLIELPTSTLTLLESRAEIRSGVQQPDLGGLIVAKIEPPNPEALATAAREFQPLPEVEFAFLQPLGVPPPWDIPPPTPNLTSFQTYRGPNPGMDIEYAWGFGGRGADVRLSDCEYGWNANHEDLNDVDLHLEPGQTINPQVYALGYDEHGTAVLGELSAPVNGYGCSGMVPEAGIYTYPEWTLSGYRRVTAIANAIANSSPGDVVLLEMQTVGTGGEGSYVPAEFDPAVWLVVRTGTDGGVIVIGAAGNGNQDLDSPPYQEYRNRGDSGSIIVGAGSSDTNHYRLSFSTFGSRVNVQGWGQSVFTAGYGSYAEYGGDRNQRYTAFFSGTSSASPFAAAASVALQSIARRTGANLSPNGMRDLLIDTGIAQGSGGHIGPFVSMPAAVDALAERLPQCHAGGPYSATAGESITFDGSQSTDPDGQVVVYTWDFGDGTSGTGPTPAHEYSSSGTFGIGLCVGDDQGNESCCGTTAEINAIPVCSAGGPYAGVVGEAIAFDGTASIDPDGMITSYEWSFGDGGTGAGHSPTHAYSTQGVFAVSLTVTDNRQAVSTCETSANIGPPDNLPPVAEANGPYAGNMGQVISFSSAGSSDPNGDPLTYLWAFGDGATSTQANPSHAYVVGGEYTVTLRATDPGGLFAEDTAQATIVATFAWVDVTTGPLGDPGNGVGVAWGDCDGDYDTDLIITNRGGQNHLLRNDDGDTFIDVTTGALGDTGDNMGAVWGDYNNDGNLDLYLARTGESNRLFRNDGGNVLTDVTTGPLGDSGHGQSVAWADYDRDGDLDLYVANYFETNKLFRNDGAGEFTDATTGPLADPDHGTGIAWGDYDSDGDPDLYLANDGSANKIFRNDGGGTFTDVTTGPLGDSGDGFGVAWADYDNDGDLDLYLANSGQANKLLRNEGGGVFLDATTSPLDDAGHGRGVAWGDIDNDGDLDLYLANSGEANKLFRNQGGGVFVDATTEPLGDGGNGRGVAFADYDNDGDLDLYLANMGQPNRLFRNELSSGSHWLELNLRGTVSNRTGIGARVRIVTGLGSQVREVSGGSGFASQDAQTVHFGLSAVPVIDTLEVKWPSGEVQREFMVAADQILSIVEPENTGLEPAALQLQYRFHSARPNPFNSLAAIPYDLPEPTTVTLCIVDSTGRLVRLLLDSVSQGAGHYEARWDGRDAAGNRMPSGVYFCKLDSRAYSRIQRIVLLR